MDEFKLDGKVIEVTEHRTIKRITLRNYLVNALESFNLERGGIYTLKMFFINPGKMGREYVGTHRYKITAPFKVLILSTTAVLLLINYSDFTDGFIDGFTAVDSSKDSANLQRTFSHLQDYFNLILWSFIPISASITYFFNYKKGLNYAENLVYQTLLLSLTNLLFLASAPIFLISYHAALIFYTVTSSIYIIYSYKSFFGRSWLRSIFHAAVFLTVGTLIWTALLGLFVILLV